MPDIGIVTEPHIEMWNNFLNKSDVSIDEDVERLYDYVRYIHTMSPQDKAIDLGNAIMIIDSIQGAMTERATTIEVRRISGECIGRVLAHIIYNREIHNLNFINGCEDVNTVKSVIVDGAVQICAEAGADTEAEGVGINFVGFMADKILD